ncbi:hypothetical protein [Phenylobacterium deserti]|uniref:Uncharacterized protein n=1 Tax=Phenylobacterium deserti TaxID=1914756 RepID=A0A328ACW1_9CAUL|nr:hypothetical protein [Phenylobacterium deserti]RAK52653.1 hypothetical protein DJ018_10660 [Phenylobacterium deserti]
MKQHTGDEIRTIMAEMPPAAIEALQTPHRDHQITEREARWWGYLMFARTGAYEGEAFTVSVMGTGGTWTQRFLDYVLADRASDARWGLKRKAWPESGFEKVA